MRFDFFFNGRGRQDSLQLAKHPLDKESAPKVDTMVAKLVADINATIATSNTDAVVLKKSNKVLANKA